MISAVQAKCPLLYAILKHPEIRSQFTPTLQRIHYVIHRLYVVIH